MQKLYQQRQSPPNGQEENIYQNLSEEYLRSPEYGKYLRDQERRREQEQRLDQEYQEQLRQREFQRHQEHLQEQERRRNQYLFNAEYQQSVVRGQKEDVQQGSIQQGSHQPESRQQGNGHQRLQYQSRQPDLRWECAEQSQLHPRPLNQQQQQPQTNHLPTVSPRQNQHQNQNQRTVVRLQDQQQNQQQQALARLRFESPAIHTCKGNARGEHAGSEQNSLRRV